MIDCHVIVSADTPRAWVQQCLASVDAAITRAPWPVELHVVAGVPGHIGRARAAGYALGTHPYVTCVDDDDYLLPDAFAAVGEAMACAPDAVFPRETTLQNGHFRLGWPRHHLAIYRRAVLIDHAAWTCCGDLAQRVSASRGRVVDVDHAVYVHRLYSKSKARVLRRARPHELERARG